MHRYVYVTKYEIINSPSRRDGISLEEELEQRRKLALIIQQAGIKLRLYPLFC